MRWESLEKHFSTTNHLGSRHVPHCSPVVMNVAGIVPLYLLITRFKLEKAPNAAVSFLVRTSGMMPAQRGYQCAAVNCSFLALLVILKS